jgi:radical SAM superfamily enzyme YgiQ (UPF0313 family)
LGIHNGILLNCMPPALVQMPSPALNILKSVLNQNQFVSEIIYWNIKFEKMHSEWSVLFNDDDFELSRLLPFVYSLVKQHKDDHQSKEIISLLMANSKKQKTRNEHYFAQLPDKTHEFTTRFIEKELKAFDFTNVILSGFSSKFYQWVPAIQVAEATKRLHPDIKTVIGGFDSKASAVEMMRIFNCFDFAVWGEGEYPLLELATALTEKRKGGYDICGLVYREADQIIFSEKRNRKFFVLNQYPNPDCDDFFSIAKEHEEKGEYLYYPIESTRGCDWNRCKFCVLGNGYKYRERDAESVVEEIRYAIKKYNFGYFEFLDNNVVGSNCERFETLLAKLTGLIIDNENDINLFAEIIPFELDAAFYKRFALAGFRMVQIGGESFSDSLIRKMNKKNSFSDNLLGYKCCIKYGIRAVGSNILVGIPGETVEDVNECIENIPFLRFFTGDQLIRFVESPFSLDKLSRFYKELSAEEIEKYNSHFIYNLLPAGLTKKMNRFELFPFTKAKLPNKKLWDKFFKILESYYNIPFSYKIFRHENLVIYEEFNNNVKVVSLVFDQPEQWEILVIANNRVISFQEMFETIQLKFRKISLKSLKKTMNELKSKYLLYCNDNYDNIVSIIDTDMIL